VAQVDEVLEQAAQRHHAEPARDQQEVVARELVDREAVAERAADADQITLADVVEQVGGEGPGAADAELEGTPPGGRGGQGEGRLADPEDRQLDELPRAVLEALGEIGRLEPEVKEARVRDLLGDPHDPGGRRLVGVGAGQGDASRTAVRPRFGKIGTHRSPRTWPKTSTTLIPVGQFSMQRPHPTQDGTPNSRTNASCLW
jgi:hypothetical protein